MRFTGFGEIAVMMIRTHLAIYCVLITFTHARAAESVADFLREELPRYTELYRQLHAAPELSLHEKETSRTMAAQLRELGFDAISSQANFVWCTHGSIPVEPIYQHLKKAGVLVRYMMYPNWGDGLRITVGTDGQVDVCLALLRSLV